MAVEEYAADTAEAKENLENAAVQRQVTVQALTATNTTIAQNLMEANHQLDEALSIIAALQVNGGGINFGGRGPGRGRGGGRGGVGERGRIVGRGGHGGGRGRTIRMYNNHHYYHTNGYGIHDTHRSETCNTSAVEQRHDTTLADKKGGS